MLAAVNDAPTPRSSPALIGEAGAVSDLWDAARKKLPQAPAALAQEAPRIEAPFGDRAPPLPVNGYHCGAAGAIDRIADEGRGFWGFERNVGGCAGWDAHCTQRLAGQRGDRHHRQLAQRAVAASAQ